CVIIDNRVISVIDTEIRQHPITRVPPVTTLFLSLLILLVRAGRLRCLLDEMGALDLAAHPHPVPPRWDLRPCRPSVHLALELMEAVVNADCGPGRNYETYVRGGQS